MEQVLQRVAARQRPHQPPHAGAHHRPDLDQFQAARIRSPRSPRRGRAGLCRVALLGDQWAGRPRRQAGKLCRVAFSGDLVSCSCSIRSWFRGSRTQAEARSVRYSRQFAFPSSTAPASEVIGSLLNSSRSPRATRYGDPEVHRPKGRCFGFDGKSAALSPTRNLSFDNALAFSQSLTRRPACWLELPGLFDPDGYAVQSTW